MDLRSVSPQMSGMFQQLGGGKGFELDLSAKGLIHLAQGGIQSAEGFNKDLTALLQQNAIPMGKMPQVQNTSIVPNKSSLEGVQKMGKHFLDAVHTSLLTAQKEQEKIITGESTNIQQSIISMHEANAFLSIMINFGVKFQEFYRAMMQTQV